MENVLGRHERRALALRITIDYRRSSMDVDRHSAEVWASWFRCLGDPSRILLLNRLAVARRPMTVGELVGQADIGQSTVSHHLAILAETGFVLCERQANTRRYWVNERCLERFPSAADLIMGVLPRYQPRAPECAPPWHEAPVEATRPKRRARRPVHA
jgi:DNA-binding transcriptional ArsR family regulator